MSSRCRASPPREAGGCEAAPRIPGAPALLGRALCHYYYYFAFFFFFPHPIPFRCPAPRRAVPLRAQVAPCAPAGAALSPLSAAPGRGERPPAPAPPPPPPPRGAAPPGHGAGGREACGRSLSGGEGRTRPRGGSPALAMKRKQKRFLQMTLLFTAALIFLPDIGLWSLYREKHLVKPAEPAEPQTVPLGLGDGQLFTWTDGLKRKDWHDYESIQKDAMRSGKGEHGKPYPLTEEDHDDSAYRENGFNIFVSNNIALERSLPDIRHPNCKHKVYLEKLPNTSIIIPFHNEGWTSLLRTIHSIINRTPDSLIAEIILVDDFSDRGKMAILRHEMELERESTPAVGDLE
uniref:Polypeptide N-acetylgalactosaminyltransferase like 6 n=1 Tax=Phasianus colchicus TaxID=9054 RepID=A0A669QGI1_PHACC